MVVFDVEFKVFLNSRHEEADSNLVIDQTVQLISLTLQDDLKLLGNGARC